MNIPTNVDATGSWKFSDANFEAASKNTGAYRFSINNLVLGGRYLSEMGSIDISKNDTFQNYLINDVIKASFEIATNNTKLSENGQLDGVWYNYPMTLPIGSSVTTLEAGESTISYIYLHNKYILGFPDGKFYSQEGLNRGEFAIIIGRLARESNLVGNKKALEYKDVKKTDYFYKDLQYVTTLGYFNGYPDGNFKAFDKITVAEFTTVMSKIVEEYDMGVSGDIWYENYLELLEVYNVQSIFAPDPNYDAPIRREHTVHIINKIINLNIDKDRIEKDKSLLVTYSDVDKSSPFYYDIIAAANSFTFKEAWVDIMKNDGNWTCKSYLVGIGMEDFEYKINK